MQSLLHSANLTADCDTNNQDSNGRPLSRFSNLNQLRAQAERLTEIDAVKAQAVALLHQPFMADGRQQFLVPRAEADAFLSVVAALNSQVALVRSIIDQTVPQESPTTIAVGFPKVNTLSEMAQMAKFVEGYFERFVGLPIGDGDDRVGHVALEGVDTGSIWTLIEAHRPEVVTLVGLAMRYAYDMLKWKRTRAAEASLIEISVAEAADIHKHNKSLRRGIRRRYAEQMRDVVAKKATTEEIARMASIVERGERVIARHVQIVPSLMAAHEVRIAFPSLTKPKVSPHELQLPEVPEEPEHKQLGEGAAPDEEGLDEPDEQEGKS
jgi:hypothetical protein